MKKIIIVFLFFYSTVVFSQTNNYNLYLDVGYKTIILDKGCGPVFGLSFYSPDKKISLSLRNDIIFDIGKATYADTNGINKSEKLEILDYRTQSYFEGEYKFRIKNTLLFTCLGVGWRYLGDSENFRLNRETGYFTLTPSVKYNIDWFTLELRGDIPLKDKYFKKYNGTERLFPVSFTLIYRFKPKKHT